MQKQAKGTGQHVERPNWTSVEQYKAQMISLHGTERLTEHLEKTYSIKVERIKELDFGVFQVTLDEGPAWVARVFPSVRPIATVRADAEILAFLLEHGVPAERWARPEPVSVLEGQGVLVTEFVVGSMPRGATRTLFRLGALLGRIHSLQPTSGAATREGGAWHHLSVHGGLREEIDSMRSLLETMTVPADQQALHDILMNELDHAEDCEGLSQAFIHPDYTLVNMVAPPGGGIVLLDWAGAGQGRRILSLGFFLWTSGQDSLANVDAILSGYRRHIDLDPEELDRLPGVLRLRPLVFSCWKVAMGMISLSDAVLKLDQERELADTIAARARQVLEKAPSAAPPTTK